MELQKNRIAMVSPALEAYSETFIQAQKKGLKVQVFYYYGGFTPFFLEGFGRLIKPWMSWMVKIKRKLGYKTFNANETAFIHSLKKNKIQLVFAQYGPTASHIVKICQSLNIPMVTHFHGYDASIIDVIKKYNNYKDVFEFSNYVIAVSLMMQNQLIALGCPKDKVIYNPYGPDPSFLEVKPQFKQKTFIGLGRFVDKKAPYYTILAFKKVLDTFPDAQLVIGGQGALYEVCKNLVRYLNIEENVLLPGVLSREAFKEYLGNGLAFVQHSITAANGDMEGTPVSILEASAAGLPVIATIHAGIPDVIVHDKTGMLSQEHDVDAMGENMLKIINDLGYAKKLGAAGKDTVKSKFSMERHLEVLEDIIYKSIINNKN
jgi:colanic acid/amylovoran biosynthesis glycosyltransferase